MAATDRPTLGLIVDFQIETAQQQTDRNFWQRLREMQVSTPEGYRIRRHMWPILQLQPPTPKSPNKLLGILSTYASLLFESEAVFYPDDPQLESWLTKLADRIVKRVLDVVAQLEESGSDQMVSLSHHCVSLSQMQEAMNTTLAEVIKPRLKQDSSQPPTPSAIRIKENCEAVGKQIDDLRTECRWTVEELAEEIKLAPRSVYRHLSGDANPRKRQVAAYEKAFSEKLKRHVRLTVT